MSILLRQWISGCFTSPYFWETVNYCTPVPPPQEICWHIWLAGLMNRAWWWKKSLNDATSVFLGVAPHPKTSDSHDFDIERGGICTGSVSFVGDDNEKKVGFLEIHSPSMMNSTISRPGTLDWNTGCHHHPQKINGNQGRPSPFYSPVYKTGRCFVQTPLGDSQWNHLKKTFT